MGNNDTNKNTFTYQKNFPSLPSCCCVEPCFYHNIDVDIPVDNQNTCKIVFHIWQFYVFCLFFNCIAALAALCIGYNETFGLAFAYFLLFPSCSFIGWYRPIYKALRSDSSFQYIVFFSMFFIQIVVTLVCAGGVSVLGTCGWVNAVTLVSSDHKSKNAVAALFFVSAVLFTLLAIFEILLLRKLHKTYRGSGAPLDKSRKGLVDGVGDDVIAVEVQPVTDNQVESAGLSTSY